MRKELLVCFLVSVFCLTAPGSAAMNIIWVSDAHVPAADLAGGDNVAPDWQAVETPWDQPWVDLLVSQGHSVDYTKGADFGDGFWRTLDEDKIATLNAADLVIISRDTSSGSYNNDDEGSQWNSVATPMILMNSYLARSSRWKWFDTTSNTGGGDAPLMDAAPPFEALFQDLEVLDGSVGKGDTSFILAKDAGNGMAIGLVDTDFPSEAEGGVDDLAASIWLALWDEGVEFYDGAGETAAAKRMYFAAGTWEGDDAEGTYWGQGMYNLTPEGEALFTAAVETIPEPATIALLGLGGLALLRVRRRR
jgi:hypothetical protein